MFLIALMEDSNSLCHHLSVCFAVIFLLSVYCYSVFIKWAMTACVSGLPSSFMFLSVTNTGAGGGATVSLHCHHVIERIKNSNFCTSIRG